MKILSVDRSREMHASVHCTLLSSSLLSKNIKIKIESYNLFVALYGCETWCLTLRGKHTLMVFENRMLRRIFGPKMDEVK
jgi:hypothetical protein